MSDTVVNFYETVDDKLLKFAVIIAKHKGKFVFCKHKERDTYEVPGGHRETGESIDETARRELQHSEIERIIITDKLPEKRTYPLIQPKLMEEAVRRGVI